MKILELLKKRRNEDGSLYIWYLVGFSLMMGLVGLSVDIGFNTYSRSTLQNSLDTAVVAAASKTTTTSNGSINFDTQAARNTIVSLHSKNRQNVGGIYCASNVSLDGINNLKSGEQFAGSGNCWILTNFSVNQSEGTITASIREYKPNYFIKMMGIDYQEFQLTSTARLTSNLE